MDTYTYGRTPTPNESLSGTCLSSSSHLADIENKSNNCILLTSTYGSHFAGSLGGTATGKMCSLIECLLEGLLLLLSLAPSLSLLARKT